MKLRLILKVIAKDSRLIKASLLLLFFAQTSFPSFAQMSKLSVQLLLNLNGGSRNTADGLVAVYADRFSTSIGNEDSYKFTNPDENLAIARNGINLSIEGRPTITGRDTLPLKVWHFKQNNYYLKLDGSNFSPFLKAYVKDTYLNTITPVNLAGNTIVALNINSNPESYSVNRFCILFETKTPMPFKLRELSVRSKGKAMELGKNSLIKSIKIARGVKNSGAKFRKATEVAEIAATVAETNSTDIADTTVFNETASANGTVKNTPLQKANAISEMTVYPNPIKGKTIGLKLTRMEKGTYTISLYHQGGQIVYATTIEHVGGTYNSRITIDKLVSRGMYTLRVSGKSTAASRLLVFE